MNPLDQTDTVYAQLKQGIFLSDLHLFSPRSAAEHVVEGIRQYHQSHEFVVLGGDIFDLRWSDRGSLSQTLEAAYQWLVELFKQTGKCQIIYLVGNHDCHPRWLDRLAELAEREARFSWHEHACCHGDRLFLHGDILDAGETESDLRAYREKFHHADAQPIAAHKSYDVAVAMRIHKLIPWLRNRPHKTCARLSQLLAAQQLQANFQRVYFGHTHYPVHGHQHGHLKFFNCGAALKHMRYYPHHVTVNNHG